MYFVKPSFTVLSDFSRISILRLIEEAGRTCYKSNSAYTEATGAAFIKKIMKRGHLSVIEHVNITVKMVVNRGVTHELVRHRIASYSQESTRFCDYADDAKFAGQLAVIEWPSELVDADIFAEYKAAMVDAEKHYRKLREFGVSPQIARNVLPINTRAEIVITANLREWRHIFMMRCAKDAHPQIREIMLRVLTRFNEVLPEVYEDLYAQFSVDKGGVYDDGGECCVREMNREVGSRRFYKCCGCHFEMRSHSGYIYDTVRCPKCKKSEMILCEDKMFVREFVSERQENESG